MKYSKVKTLGQINKSIINRKPILFLWIFIYTITNTIFFVCGVVYPKTIIDLISQLETFDMIFYHISIMSIILIISSIISQMTLSTIEYLPLFVRLEEFNVFIDYYYRLKHSHIENPKFQDSISTNIDSLNSSQTGFEGVIRNLFLLGSLFFIAIIYSYILIKFNLIVFTSIIMCFVFSVFFTTKGKKYALKKDPISRHEQRKMNEYFKIGSDFNYTKDIKIYSLKDKLMNLITDSVKKRLKNVKNIQKVQLVYAFFSNLFLILAQGITIYFVVKSNITSGEIILYLSTSLALTLTLTSIIKNIVEIYEWLGHTSVYYQMIFDHSNMDLDTGLDSGLEETFKIEFVDVSFKYPGTDIEVLKDLSFVVNKGEKIAIVGENGAGKTTIVKLICGLFEVTSGKILINDIDINQFNKKYLYSRFSVVFQEVNIFAFSILENVSLKPVENTDFNKAKECIEKVGLLNKIESFDNQFNTIMLKTIDENGVLFSGGENQKLAIARALYQDGVCLILDEPTSALDALKEEEIYKDFDKLCDNQTTIYISHRLASTKFCHRILFFTKEGLCESGTHDELMNLKNKYHDMFVTQGKYYQEGSDD